MDDVSIKTMKLLKANRGNLTRQQFNTLKGQVLAGDVDGARRGLQKLLTRRESLASAT